MFNNNLKLIGLLVVILTLASIITTPNITQAAENLTVVFEPNPLFTEGNFLPGQSVIGRIMVINQSGETKPMAAEAINVDDPANFGQALNLTIKEKGDELFNDALSNFFSQGEMFLSNLSDNNSTTYEFIVTFNQEVDNNWQGQSLNNFDILIGFQGEESEQVSSALNGGGGNAVSSGLTIFNKATIEAEDTSAVITWQTNYFSTSRVIYGAEFESHLFDYSNPPNYGYGHSSVEDPTKVTDHQVVLTGLIPNTLYYYRVISHASPDTVSREYTFKTAESAQTSQTLQNQEQIENQFSAPAAGLLNQNLNYVRLPLADNEPNSNLTEAEILTENNMAAVGEEQNQGNKILLSQANFSPSGQVAGVQTQNYQPVFWRLILMLALIIFGCCLYYLFKLLVNRRLDK